MESTGFLFDPKLILCSGYLAMYNPHGHREPEQGLDDASRKMAMGCRMQMSTVSPTTTRRMYPILEQLQRLTPTLAGFSAYDVRDFWALWIGLNAGKESNSSSALTPTTRALLLDKIMSFGDTCFLSIAIYCVATPFVLSKIKKGLNRTSSGHKNGRAEFTISSSKLPQIRFALGEILQNYGQRQRRVSWLLYHAIVGGISESHPISVPFIQLLLHKGANPNFRVPFAPIHASQPSPDTNESSPWIIALAIAIRVSSDDQEDRRAAEPWGRVVKLMLSFGGSVNRDVVSQSLHMLGSDKYRDISAAVGEGTVLQALVAARSRTTPFSLSGYSLEGIRKGIV